MVARKFSVCHENSTFDLDYDTEDGLEVLKFQLFSLTSVPPDEQQIVSGDDSKAVNDDSDLISISENLRLISINDHVQDSEAESSSKIGDAHVDDDFLKSDEEFARMLQAEEEALLLQQYVASEDNGQMEQKIRGYIDQVLMEDPNRQEAARKTVPVDELEEKALVAIAKKEGMYNPTKDERDHAFLLELLFWFKQSFSWVHALPCDGCGNQTTSQGMCEPLPEEIRYGGVRVELYSIKDYGTLSLSLVKKPRKPGRLEM